MARPDPSFLLLSPPYRTLQPIAMDDALPEGEDARLKLVGPRGDLGWGTVPQANGGRWPAPNAMIR